MGLAVRNYYCDRVILGSIADRFHNGLTETRRDFEGGRLRREYNYIYIYNIILLIIKNREAKWFGDCLYICFV